MPDPEFPAPAVWARLSAIAQSDTGQARPVADFFLAWHNASQNGAWDPTDLWRVDWLTANDFVQALGLLLASKAYPGDLGFAPEIDPIWWRGPESSSPQESDATAPGMV